MTSRGPGRQARAVCIASLLLVAVTLLPAPASGQFFNFGLNKVQYRSFDWHVLRGAHVDLYYYPAERELASVALRYAEASYDTLALQFGHEVPTRIPLIVYASHVDFEQTNVLDFAPSEDLLGVTDFLKRRVSLPFRGSLSDFRHTLRHELVHVFQLSIESEAYLQAPRAQRPNFPLWWTEGLAELWSAGEDARDEMVLRDLVLSGRMPTLMQLRFASGGLVYPIGGRIHRWLADTYGDWRVALLYRELNQHATFEDAIAAVYGRPVTRLNEEWQLAMRRAYYPTAATRAPLTVLARPVAPFAIKPIPVPADPADTLRPDALGDAIYLSPRTGWLTVYRKAIESPGGGHALVTGGRSAGLETLHPFASRMDASRRGFLLLSARYRDRDALVVWNVRRNRLAGRYQFPSLVSVLSPRWMPDGSIVFSGLSEGGVSDLYRLRLPGGQLEQLTRDHYQDLDPSPSADGSRLVFASDRTAGGIDGAVNLFMLDLQSGGVRQLTSGKWVDETPVWAQDGRIYYTSDRDGVLNVFSCDSTGAARRETSAWTGAFDAEPIPGKEGLLVSGFHDLSWNAYYYAPDSTARAETFAAPDSVPAGLAWAWEGDSGTAVASTEHRTSEPYRRKYTLDIATGEALFVPGYGGAQGLAFLATDMLGDNAFFGSVSSYQGRELGSLLANLSVTGLYINRAHRLNWGVGGFRVRSRNYEGDLTVSYNESAVGAIGLLRYPFSVFDRVEGTFTLERSDRVDFTLPVDEPRRVGLIASHYLSFVHDNSLFIPSGPIDGERFSVTAGVSSDFSNGRFDGWTGSADWRRYFRIAGRTAFATRAFGFYGGGDRPQRVNIGGTLGLRGYPNYGYIVGTRAWMFNQEVRFPLLEHIVLGTPAGDLTFPEVQGALFFDVGKATYDHVGQRAVLGSYGASFRMALAPLAVVRLDVGRRFSNDDYRGYSLDADRKRRSFVTFFFGYNY
jgi:hypothetical protein